MLFLFALQYDLTHVTMLDLPHAEGGAQRFMLAGKVPMRQPPQPCLNFILFFKAEVFVCIFCTGVSKGTGRCPGALVVTL